MLRSNVSGSKFLGSRYRKNGDPGVSTLYDVNGYIAGLQTSVGKHRETGLDKN